MNKYSLFIILITGFNFNCSNKVCRHVCDFPYYYFYEDNSLDCSDSSLSIQLLDIHNDSLHDLIYKKYEKIWGKKGKFSPPKELYLPPRYPFENFFRPLLLDITNNTSRQMIVFQDISCSFFHPLKYKVLDFDLIRNGIRTASLYKVWDIEMKDTKINYYGVCYYKLKPGESVMTLIFLNMAQMAYFIEKENGKIDFNVDSIESHKFQVEITYAPKRMLQKEGLLKRDGIYFNKDNDFFYGKSNVLLIKDNNKDTLRNVFSNIQKNAFIKWMKNKIK